MCLHERFTKMKRTCKSSSSLINSIASSICNLPRKIPRAITKECAADARASIAANSQSSVFFRRFSTAFVRPSSCIPPKKLEYTIGLKPNSEFTQASKGSTFSTCLAANVGYYCILVFTLNQAYYNETKQKGIQFSIKHMPDNSISKKA